MELLLANAGKVRRTNLNGREYLVAPMTLIVHGVLNGSKGSLYYPLQEISREPGIWNHIPIVVYHPIVNGENVSAKDPGVLDRSGIGILRNSKIDNDRLRAEGWFDVERTRKVDPRVLNALENNRSIELSTGLYTENEPAPMGANYKGVGYEFIARNYKPDHLAILPDQIGACGIRDGCGVLVNSNGNHFVQGVRTYRTASGKILFVDNANPEGCNQYKSCDGGGEGEGSTAVPYSREVNHSDIRKVKPTKSAGMGERVRLSDGRVWEYKGISGHAIDNKSRINGWQMVGRSAKVETVKEVEEPVKSKSKKGKVEDHPEAIKIADELLSKHKDRIKDVKDWEVIQSSYDQYKQELKDAGVIPTDIAYGFKKGRPPTSNESYVDIDGVSNSTHVISPSGDEAVDGVSPVELSSNSTRLERFIHWLIGNVSVENCGGKGGKPGPCPSGRKAYVPHPRQPGAPKPDIVKPPRAKAVKPLTAPTPKPPTPTAKTPTKPTPVPKTPKPPVTPPTPTPAPTPPPSPKVPTPTKGKGKAPKDTEPQPVKPNSKLLKSTVDDVHGHITDLLKNPDKITAKHVEETATKLMSLSAKDMRGLGDKLGITGLKGSDLKAKLAEKISKGSLEGKGGSKDTDKEQGSGKTPTEPTKQPDKQPEAVKPPTQETPKPSTDTKSEIKEAGVAGSGKVASRDDFAHELRQHLDKEGISKYDTDETNKKVEELMDKYSKSAGSVKPHWTDAEDMNVIDMEGIKFHYSKESKGEAANLIRQTLNKNAMPDRLLQATGDVVFASNEIVKNGARTLASAGADGRISFYKGGADMETLTHEAGHLLARQKWDTSAPPANSDYSKAQREEKPVSEYGATKPAEDFAEAVMMYSTDKHSFKSNFPKKHDAIEKMMNESREYHEKEKQDALQRLFDQPLILDD